jgi:hypothetical protein
METKKEFWIEQTLNSSKELKSVPISESLRKRLEAIPQTIEIFDKRIPMKAIWLAAASIALLITVNIATFNKTQKVENQESTVYNEYFSYLDQL